jgi:hypothetical protein
MLSNSAIEELREIYQRCLGKIISADEARERGQRLVALVGVAVRVPRTELGKATDRAEFFESKL